MAGNPATSHFYDRPVLVAGTMAIGSVAAVLSPAAPTGTRVIDMVLVAGSAAFVIFTASRARRAAWLASGAIITAGAADTAVLAIVVLALVVAMAGISLESRSRLVGSVVGGLLVNAALRLTGDWFFGASALVAAAGIAPMIISGWLHMRTRHRRPLLAVGLLVAGIAVLGVAALGRMAATSRADAEVAADHARHALDLLSDADAEGARAELSLAAAAFRRVEARSDSWWAAPARLVPVAAQHRRAVADLAHTGAVLSERLADATAVADIEGVELRDGRLDLSALTSLLGPAESAVAALEEADHAAIRADSGWLVSPLARRVDAFHGDITDALEPARLAAEGARVVPGLLGSDEPRRYVVLFANPAESRELGGFVGGVGILEANEGELDFGGVEEISALAAALGDARVPPVAGIPASYAASRPNVFPQNWTASPDLPTVGEVVSTLWPLLRSEPVDGVLYVDPYAVEALLGLTGPVTVPGIPHPVDSDNAVDFLLRDQYTELAGSPQGDEAARQEYLADVGDVVFERLTTGSLPGPRALARTLGPAVRGRHLLLWTMDDEPTSLLADLGLDGALPAPTGDLFHLTQSNTRANKLDAYLTRTVSYDAALDEGAIEAEATVSLRSSADPDALPDYVSGRGDDDGLGAGVNRINLTLYSPWPLVGATVDGQPVGAASVRVGEVWQHTILVTIPPTSDRTVVLRLEGSFGEDAYRLTAVPFAGATADDLQVTVTEGGAAETVHDGPMTAPLTLGRSGRTG